MVIDGGGLRYVRLGNREILRRVYFALHDHIWNTISVRVSNLRKDVRYDSFRISCETENKQHGIDYAWEGTITWANGWHQYLRRAGGSPIHVPEQQSWDLCSAPDPRV
jgi:hypothetical protein